MSNEKQDSYENWKRKLNNLNSLPGEIMPDKNELWEKLHARLSENKHSKNVIWYWVAAACILLVLIIPVIFRNNRMDQLAKDEISQNQPEIKTFITRKPVQKDPIKVGNPVLSGENTITVAEKLYKTRNIVIPQEQINKFRLYHTVSTENLTTGTLNNSIQTVDTATYLTTTIPVKKKLPVVHINELGDPVNVPEEVARNSDKRPFLFLKLASQEVYSTPSVSATKDFATINLKTSSN